MQIKEQIQGNNKRYEVEYVKISYKDTFGKGLKCMKKNAAQREFKKLKGQIANIEDIIKHSKAGALVEQETALRKKLKALKEMENQGFREYKEVVMKYEEALEEASKKLLEDYNRKNKTSFDFYDVIAGNYNSFLNSGFMTVLTKLHIPKIVGEEFEKNFPENPKDEYKLARAIKRKVIIHLGDTNTGKTYNAIERLKNAKKGIYLSPLRILALENYEKLNNEGVTCDLMTGEEEIINENSTHVSCTIEKVNLNEEYDIAVIDEIQMIGDSRRGMAWSRALLGLRCKEIHICGALNTKELLQKILTDCNDDYEINEYTRNTPLEVENKNFSYNDTKEGDAIVVFSKKRVLEIAQSYSEKGIKASIIYGDLPPEVRKMQYAEFLNKETKVLVTTDAIGMGVNLPIRRIIFMSVSKYDGEEVRELTSQEVKQVAGRAGRGQDKGNVIIQTYNPDNLSIEYSKEQNYRLFYNTEIIIRKQLKYPPFCDIILIGFSSENEKNVIESARFMYMSLKNKIINEKLQIILYKPVPAPIDKIKNKIRWRIIIKCKFNNEIIEALNTSLKDLNSKKLKDVKTVIDLNPTNMM